jgi:hypothetical protein
MRTRRIKCKNDHCSNHLRIELKDIQSYPILFCSEQCLNSLLSENDKSSNDFNYEDPKEVRQVVQNLLSETKQIQNELKNLRRIRKAYFGIFKDYDLKDEVYTREWSFDKTKK